MKGNEKKQESIEQQERKAVGQEEPEMKSGQNKRESSSQQMDVKKEHKHDEHCGCGM